MERKAQAFNQRLVLPFSITLFSSLSISLTVAQDFTSDSFLEHCNATENFIIYDDVYVEVYGQWQQNNFSLESRGSFDIDGTYTSWGITQNINYVSNFGIINNWANFINEGDFRNNCLVVNHIFFSVTGEVEGDGAYQQLSGHAQVNGRLYQQLIDTEDGSLSGEGIIEGRVVIGDEASVNPGNSPGIWHFMGDVLFEEDSLSITLLC